MSAGAVYFWIPDTFDPSAGGHVMKIGLSTNPIGRARDIQSTSPHKLLQLWLLKHPRRALPMGNGFASRRSTGGL